MFFKEILKQLTDGVDGAEGAIVVESDGEAVEWYSATDADRLRLRSAYVALTMQSCETSLDNLSLKKTEAILIEYEGASFLAEDLGSGYFLILELNASANLGQANGKIQEAAEILRKEVA